MTGADVEDPSPPRGGGMCAPGSACDLHLACGSPLCDALGGLAWSRQVVWFHDFGLLPLAGGLQLRLGATPPGGAPASIRALTATLVAPGAGAIATQEFPLASYANRERDAASAIVLCEQGGRFRFVSGMEHIPISDAQRRRLATVCRAIEAWAGLLSGGGLPGAAPDAPERAGCDEALAGGDHEELVVTDEVQEPPGAS